MRGKKASGFGKNDLMFSHVALQDNTQDTTKYFIITFFMTTFMSHRRAEGMSMKEGKIKRERKRRRDEKKEKPGWPKHW